LVGASNAKLAHINSWQELAGQITFHDREEIGPKMLARIAKKTGLRPEDL